MCCIDFSFFRIFFSFFLTIKATGKNSLRFFVCNHNQVLKKFCKNFKNEKNFFKLMLISVQLGAIGNSFGEREKLTILLEKKLIQNWRWEEYKWRKDPLKQNLIKFNLFFFCFCFFMLNKYINIIISSFFF